MIWDRRPSPSDDRAARYWDDLVQGHAADTDGLDSDVVATIQALHALDDSPDPDPAFVARLRDDLLADTPAETNGVAPAVPARLRTEPDTLPPTLPPPHEPAHARRARWGRELAGMVAAAVLLLALGGVLASVLRERAAAPGGPAAAPGWTSEIVYAGVAGDPREGNIRLFAVAPDGSNRRTLTNWRGTNISPAWSPDGKRIAFVSSRSGSTELYVMDADGRNVQQVTDLGWWIERPSWSPKGVQIAFTCYPNGVGDQPSVCVIDRDGGNLRNLSESIGMNGVVPSWSPDGGRIAFISSGPRTTESIYVMNADGSVAYPLMTQVDGASDPVWSPDGEWLAFSGSVDGSQDRIWVVSARGGRPRQVSANGDGMDLRPAWSPDGTRIAFVRARGLSDVVILVAEADGSGEHEISGDAPINHYPSWSPDGTEIAFVAGFLGEGERREDVVIDAVLQVVSADGSNLRTIARDLVMRPSPVWRPAGEWTAPEPTSSPTAQAVVVIYEP